MNGFKRSAKTCIALSILSVYLINACHASEENDPYIPPSAYGFNYGELNNVETNVSTLTTELMGDAIDPATGTISFSHTDVDIPGNDDIPVRIQRTLSDPDGWYSATRELGNWSLAIPHIRSTYIDIIPGSQVQQIGADSPWKRGQACSYFDVSQSPSFSKYVRSLSGNYNLHETAGLDYHNGNTISIPGKGTAKITVKNGTLTNNRNWKVDCITVAGREGFLVTTTDGMKYRFTHQREVKSLRPHYLARSQWMCDGNRGCQMAPPPNDPSINPISKIPRNSDAEMDRIHAFLQVTEIEDRYGNKVHYLYDSNGDLDRITSTDGRLIDVTFVGGKMTQASANGRVWTYKYVNTGPENSSMLSKVIQPDSREWQFDYSHDVGTDLWENAGNHSQSDPLNVNYCESFGFGKFVTITHPGGVEGEFLLAERCLAKAEVPKVENFNPYGQGNDFQSYLMPIYSQIYAVHKKTLTFADGEQYIWDYQYSTNKGYFVGDAIGQSHVNIAHFGNSNPPYIALVGDDEPQHFNGTFVTQPNGSVEVKYFDRRYGFSDGQLRYSAVFDDNNVMKMSKRFDYYTADVCGSRFRMYGYSGQQTVEVPEAWIKTRPCNSTVFSFELGHSAIENQKVKKETTFYNDGAHGSTYVEETSHYNEYDVPTRFKQSSNNSTRYIAKAYQHDLGRWLLNLPTKVYVDDAPFDNTTSYSPTVEIHESKLLSETTYHLPTHGSYASMPHEERWLGQLRKTFQSYHTTTGKKGKVKKVLFNVDLTTSPGNQRWVSFDNYHRGQSTLIVVPQRYSNDTMSMSKVVDNNGWVTRTTNFNGVNTHYGFDGMGDIRYVDYENDLSAVENWSDTLFTWTSAGEPIRTVEHCELNASRTSCINVKLKMTEYYDGFYRLKKTFSQDFVGGSANKYQRFTYNFRNQPVFTSQVSSNSLETKGTTVFYDSLGRMASQSTSGLGTVYEDYLGENTKRITDALGNETTTSYRAFGSPSYSQALTIQSPENVTTDLDYDLYGNVLEITQSGLGKNNQAVSQTEYRSYDPVTKMLCLTVRADVGATAFNYNLMGDIQWQAQGVSYNTSTRACVAKPEDKAVTMQYDNLGTLWKATYPINDATPNVVHTRDKNGNVTALSAGNVLQNYEYNNLNLLTKETVRIPGRAAYVFEHDYSPLKHQKSLTYPDGMKVSFHPNAYGQATKINIPPVSGSTHYDFAQDINYYSNGQLASFTYGNGVEYTSSQLNDAKLPSSIKSRKGSNYIVDLRYTYDDNANVKSIIDGQNSAFSLTNLQYDGLDRLTSTTGGSGIGSSLMRYDSFGNITYYRSKNRTNDYSYDYSTNMLLSVSSTGSDAKNYTSFQDDGKGNITNNSHQVMEYNLANQMTSAKGTNTYLYDGFNRRVKQTDAKGTSYSVYSQSGKLLLRETSSGQVSYIYLDGKVLAKVGITESPNGPNQHFAPFGSSIEGETDDVGYTGHKFDTDVGLSYMQARYYDPVIGRFYSNDPVGAISHLSGTQGVQGFNRYSYVNNNPYKYTDPSGMCATIEDESVRTTCEEKRDEAVEEAKEYLEKVKVKRGAKEGAFISTFDETTQKINTRTGNDAGKRSNGEVEFTDSNGDKLEAMSNEDGRIIDSNEIILVTGHSHPKEYKRMGSKLNDSRTDRKNQGIVGNTNDINLSRIAPLVIKGPDGVVRVFVKGKQVQ